MIQPKTERKKQRKLSLKERNDLPTNQRDASLEKTTIQMQDVLRLFDFILQQDPEIGRAISRVDERALQHGAKVMRGEEQLGDIESFPVLEHPRDDLKKIILYWRVMGLCPYFVMKRRLTGQRYIRVPPPHSSMRIELITDAYETRAVFHSMIGYKNPAVSKEDPGVGGQEEVIRKTSLDHKWDSTTLKPFGGEEEEEASAEIKRRDPIIDSGVFLWRDRVLYQSGGYPITPLRQLYNQAHMIQIKEVLELQALRSASRPHVWVAKGEAVSGGGRRNNLGSNVGEQLSTADLLRGMPGEEEEDEGDEEEDHPKDGDDSVAWALLALARIYGNMPGEQSADRTDLPSLTNLPPCRHNLRDGERIVGTVNNNTRGDLQKEKEDYRKAVANYTGEKIGLSSTAEEARMEKQRLNATLDDVRTILAAFWEHAYARVYEDEEKSLITDTIVKEGRELPTLEEKEMVRTGAYVRVQFVKVPEVANIDELIKAADLGALAEEETICAIRNYLSLAPLVRCEKLSLNKFALPSQVQKEKFAIEKEKAKTQKISALQKNAAPPPPKSKPP